MVKELHELSVIEVIIALATLAEGPAGQISHFVVGPRNAPGGKWGTLSDQVADCQSTDKALANQGFAGGEPASPGHSGGVVNPSGTVFVLE